MKRFFIFPFLFLFVCSLQAQDDNFRDSTIVMCEFYTPPKSDINYFTLYAGLTPFLGTHYAGLILGTHIESIFYRNWGVGISYEFRAFLTENVPQPYYPGLICFGDDGKPRDFLRIASLNAIRKFPMTNRLRLGAELGLTYVQYETPIFEYKNSSGGFLSFPSGYRQVGTKERTSFGSRTRVSFDWLLTRALGLEIGVLGQVNPIRSYVRPDIKMTVGFLRRKM